MRFCTIRSAVSDFYNARRAQASSPAVQPNAAHRALARLERMWSGEVVVVTQNVDDLHERAGSAKVLHMHGRLNQVRCNARGARHVWTGDVFVHTPCQACAAPSLRPDIVWFGEIPYHRAEIDALLAQCDLFISIGTSGLVYPAAAFVDAIPNGAHTVELNLEPSAGASLFAERHYGPATRIVPAFVEELLAPKGLATSFN